MTDETTSDLAQKRGSRWPVILLLLAILAFGAYFRFVGLNWDDGTHIHPDERFLTMVTSTIKPPADLAEYFNSATSPLNPYNYPNFPLFVYGDLPVFITRYTASLLDGACQLNSSLCTLRDNQPVVYASYEDVNLLGRFLSGVLDLLTLLFMFLIGRRLGQGDKRVGLLAAALGAATVLQIQQAHFYTADIFASFFATAALYFIVRLADTFSWVDVVACGFSVGLAVASRINVAPILGVLGLAAFAYVLARWRDPQRRVTLEGALGRVVVASLIAVIMFRVFMPYAFNGLFSLDPRWANNMSYIQTLMNGEDPGGPPGVQWANRAPIIFPLINIIFWGMGVPLGLAAWSGWAWAAWQTFITPYRRNRRGKVLDWISDVAKSRYLVIWVWVSGYFFWQATQWVKSIRYFLPIYPALVILAAAGLIALWDWARTAKHAPLWRGLAAVLIGVVVIGSFAWAWAFTEIYRQPNTRVAASRWMFDTVPTAVTAHVTQAGAPKDIQLPFRNSTDLPNDGSSAIAQFTVDQASQLQSVTINKLIDTVGDPEPETVRVILSGGADGNPPLRQADITVHAEEAGPRGGQYSFNFDPIALQANQPYYVIVQVVSGAPLQMESSTIAVEAWDESIPLSLDGRDAYGIYHGVEIQRQWEDTPEKVQHFVDMLDKSDYVTLSSNRTYGSIVQQPLRYPMTMEYFRALFSGELGYKLVGVFESSPTLGPLAFPDQETTQKLGLWPDPTRCPQAQVPQCQGLINVLFPPAEEAFSVYDHPRVLIFEKTPQFSAEAVRAKLNSVDLRDVLQNITPKAETQAPNGLMLSQPTWQAQQASDSWSDLFDRNSLLNRSPLVGVVVWYAALFLLGLFAFPIVFAVTPTLRDRGYGITRVAGLLLVTFGVWFAASLKVVPFTRGTIALSVALLAVVGAIVAWRKQAELKTFWRESRRVVLIEEALFAIAFCFFLFVRFGNPDLWHPVMGGEKPMDFAYLNAVIKSQYFPPYDPWFAGGQITYYYFGFVLVATLIKLLGIIPAIAYNLTIPMLFAMTALGAFCVAFNLVQLLERKEKPDRVQKHWLKNPFVVGVIAAVFVACMGNLGEAQLLQQQTAELSQSQFDSSILAVKQIVQSAQGLEKMIFEGKPLNMRIEWWYFTPTREIPAPPTEAGPISEFPYFTFLYADLHAHMIALPLTLLALVLAVSWLTRPPRWEWSGIAAIVLGGLTVGALRPTNTWDYPTYLLLGGTALLFGTLANEPLNLLSTWARLLVRLVGFVAVGVIAFVPFTLNYATAYSSADLWQGSLTPLWAYLNIHLLFLFPVATFLIWEFKSWGWRWWRAMWHMVLKSWQIALGTGLFLVGVAGVLLFTGGREVIIVVGPILALCALLIVRPRLSVAQRFWTFMVAVAVGLTMAVEVIVLRGDISRMNTTFKFYVQVWVLLGISAAVALSWLADRLAAWRGWAAVVWKAFMWLLVIGSFLYVPLATKYKMLDRFVPTMAPGLNGNDYMLEAAYNETADPAQAFDLKWDYGAIQWLQDNARGTPVVAEGNSPLYHWGSRISINTGLPAIIGWDWHQRQQRSVMPPSVIDNRLLDVKTLYSTVDITAAQNILDRYNVRYIIVGGLERAYYPPEGLAKFEQMVAQGKLRVVYQNEGTAVYEVVRP